MKREKKEQPPQLPCSEGQMAPAEVVKLFDASLGLLAVPWSLGGYPDLPGDDCRDCSVH
jgi:hypothetical protein